MVFGGDGVERALGLTHKAHQSCRSVTAQQGTSGAKAQRERGDCAWWQNGAAISKGPKGHLLDAVTDGLRRRLDTRARETSVSFFLCAWRQGGAEWFAKRTSGAGKEKSMQSRGARSVGLRKRREKGENWPSMRADDRTGSGLERRARRAGKVLTAGLGGVKLFREKGVGERQAAVNAAYVCEFGVERASEGDEHRFRLSARGRAERHGHGDACAVQTVHW